MKDSTGLVLVLVLVLVFGCDVGPPVGVTEVCSIAVSKSGKVAIVGSQAKGQNACIAICSDFDVSKQWRRVRAAQKQEKLLFQGEELLALREFEGKRDLYRVEDNGAKLTSFGDVLDAAAGSKGVMIVRPWEKTRYAIFSLEPDSQLRQIAIRSGLVIGTLALYDFGNGPELYWAEVNSGRASILRCTSAGGVQTLYRPRHAPTGNHPIVVLVKGRSIGCAWRSHDCVYNWSRRDHGKGCREQKNDDYSIGAVSENGQRAVGWDPATSTFDDGTLEEEEE